VPTGLTNWQRIVAQRVRERASSFAALREIESAKNRNLQVARPSKA